MSPIVVFTQRRLIREVAASWRAQYRNPDPDWWGVGVGDKLEALDLETATRAEVDAIITNSSWTRLRCSNCERSDLKKAVQVGEAPDYESATVLLCSDCVEQAARELRETREET